jgi:hypothetical protein
MSRAVKSASQGCFSETPQLYVGSIVKWTKSGDQLWVILHIQGALHVMRTLPREDGSYTTRTIQNVENLVMVQTGNFTKKDVEGTASIFSKDRMPE